MKLAVLLAVALSAALNLTAAPGEAPGGQTPGGKAVKKLTCCEEARAKGKECAHSCCIAAHKKGESCVKCNPNKEDLKKADKKGAKKDGDKPLSTAGTPPPKEAPKTAVPGKKPGAS